MHDVIPIGDLQGRLSLCGVRDKRMRSVGLGLLANDAPVEAGSYDLRAAAEGGGQGERMGRDAWRRRRRRADVSLRVVLWVCLRVSLGVSLWVSWRDRLRSRRPAQQGADEGGSPRRLARGLGGWAPSGAETRQEHGNHWFGLNRRRAGWQHARVNGGKKRRKHGAARVAVANGLHRESFGRASAFALRPRRCSACGVRSTAWLA